LEENTWALLIILSRSGVKFVRREKFILSSSFFISEMKKDFVFKSTDFKYSRFFFERSLTACKISRFLGN
jgi:hypothetical protein